MSQVERRELVLARNSDVVEPERLPKGMAEDDAPRAAVKLTPEEEKAANEHYHQKLEELREMEVGASMAQLQLIFNKGQFIDEVLGAAGGTKYGNRTIEALAKDMSPSPKRLISDSTVRAWREFFRRSSRGEMDMTKLVNNHITWSFAYYMLTVKDVSKYRSLEDSIIAGKFKNVRELQKHVKNLNAATRVKGKAEGKKVDRRGAPSPTSAFKGASLVAVTAVKRLNDMKTAIAEFRKMDEGKGRDAALKRLKEAGKNISDLSDKSAELSTLIEDTLEKYS